MAIVLKSTAKTTQSAAKKFCIYGPSGVGKTMLAATAAPFKPLIILTERTGDESLSPANIAKVFGAKQPDILYDIDIIEAYDNASFEAAVKYANTSKVHNLIIFDSGSKASYIILKEKKGINADGRKAYGAHNDAAMSLIDDLLRGDKHVVIFAHASRQEDIDTGETLYYPSFEGKSFNEAFIYDMPHVLHLEIITDEKTGDEYRALRCHQGDSNRRCKTRGGCLGALEEPHLGRLIQKLNSGKVAK